MSAAASAATRAIQAGDIDALNQLLNENPGLASERIVRGRGQSLTPLHVLTDSPGPFPNACHGGQLQAAEYLLERGADTNSIGHDDSTPLDIARRSDQNVGSPSCSEERLSELVEWLEAQGARSAKGASS